MIIAISGKAGSGKDTIGEYLCSRFGFEQDSLAAPIKRLVQDVFVIDSNTLHDRDLREQPLEQWSKWTVRQLLQFIGTEMFRKSIDEDIWVKSLCLRLQKSDDQNWIVTDVRFPNEMRVLKETFGADCLSINIVRPAQGDTGAPSGISGHESEAYDIEGEIEIINDGSLDELYEKADKALVSAGYKLERCGEA